MFFTACCITAVRIRLITISQNVHILTFASSILAVGPCKYAFAFYPHGPRLGPKPSQSQPSLTALAQPASFESPSRQKPGQSHGFQAKPGQNITNLSPLLEGHRREELFLHEIPQHVVNGCISNYMAGGNGQSQVNTRSSHDQRVTSHG